jgi:lipooligosaccharide transport system ATP-binding protein
VRGPAGDQTAPAGDGAVVASGLRKSYGARVAVDGIDFRVEPGTCFGFLGPNGAGKTTTMKMIYGLATVDGGELRVLGMDVASRRREVKARLGVVPQETNLDGEFTVLENLLVQASYYGVSHREAEPRAIQLLEFCQLEDRAEEKIMSLSGGMKRRLLVARALVNEPEIVVLDEPTTGLDPQARLALWREMESLKDSGVTLLLTTHYMEEAARLCDRLVIIDLGRIVAEGEPRELMREHDAETLEEVFLTLTGRHLREELVEGVARGIS